MTQHLSWALEQACRYSAAADAAQLHAPTHSFQIVTTVLVITVECSLQNHLQLQQFVTARCQTQSEQTQQLQARSRALRMQLHTRHVQCAIPLLSPQQ
jgi:hypothetical protein